MTTTTTISPAKRLRTDNAEILERLACDADLLKCIEAVFKLERRYGNRRPGFFQGETDGERITEMLRAVAEKFGDKFPLKEEVSEMVEIIVKKKEGIEEFLSKVEITDEHRKRYADAVNDENLSNDSVKKVCDDLMTDLGMDFDQLERKGYGYDFLFGGDNFLDGVHELCSNTATTYRISEKEYRDWVDDARQRLVEKRAEAEEEEEE